MAILIDGTLVAKEVRQELHAQVQRLILERSVVPGLAVVLVGEDPASKVYVKNKIAACEAVGIRSFHHHLTASVAEEEVLALIDSLNQNPNVDGILVQLPLPEGLSSEKILARINPSKDVDGLHAFNLGRLTQGHPHFLPCTPAGILRLLKSIDYSLTGKEAVVVGRSNIVGKPIALLLLSQHATVTICHRQTRDLDSHLLRADLVIAAAGVPRLIHGNQIKKGAVVIDVGIHREGSKKLVGDVDFETVFPVASYLTPVPGGVGPMTIAMLLSNTVQAAEKRRIQ